MPIEKTPSTQGAAILVFEVRGLIDSLRAVDAVFKAATVSHVRSLRVGGGRVAIWIEGSLTEVGTAEDAAYGAVVPGRDARSCTFTLPSPEVRAYLRATVHA